MAQTYTTNPYAGATVVATTMTAVNNNFEALKSAFSGAAAPANTVAGQWWLDTTTHLLKVRNEANDGWLTVWDMANQKPLASNLVSADFGAALKDAAAGTASLRTLGTGATQALPGNTTITPADGTVTGAKMAAYAAGDNLLFANDYVATTTSATYTKVREIYLPTSGEVRVSFSMKTSNAAHTASARIYRNGVAVGTAQTTLSTSYVSKLEDISGWSAGDLLQLYIACASGSTCSAYLLRLWVAVPQMPGDVRGFMGG